MINRKQEITGGDHSNNVQGNEVTVHQHGMSYTDVKDIAMGVFKSNFYDLGEKIEAVVNERAEKLINKYLDELKAESPESLTNTKDPDVRFVIYEAQKNHARRNDDEIADLLIDLLVSRTKQKDQKFTTLVCNEALEIIPKLTMKQINILTVLFIVKHVNIGALFSAKDFPVFLDQFLRGITSGEIAFQHLQYSGCISISIGSADINKILSYSYPNDPIIDDLHLRYAKLIELWNTTKLANSSLTSVGIAIALSNFKKKTGVTWELENWIKE
ncbi:hypothetical protein D5E69_14160 [Rossellomorea marisflavi]|uniref:LPO_1073/Vpar_1526 family protein n=1 Tax=Rossellomorea marisflavi TaxID=189381 RepID=UPI001318E794|nr:LPO_1073/Vpar_1526 family protein [Rossellomorea marisflavi]QHA36845.1 hypothetical protein D5E69_14160 [Rossellomorea marisflavi]